MSHSLSFCFLSIYSILLYISSNSQVVSFHNSTQYLLIFYTKSSIYDQPIANPNPVSLYLKNLSSSYSSVYHQSPRSSNSKFISNSFFFSVSTFATAIHIPFFLNPATSTLKRQLFTNVNLIRLLYYINLFAISCFP